MLRHAPVTFRANMSFGFSVGDFTGGATLAIQLITALSSSRGSSMEYQSLIADLELVHKTCLQIDDLRTSQQLTLSVLNGLTPLIRSCNENMEKCLVSVDFYRQSLQAGGSGSPIKDSWRKIGWSLFKPKEIKELRDCLQLKISMMNCLLSAGGW
jgi:hypothetical protein